MTRALGTDAVERVVSSEGELSSFRTMQKQPAQRERTTDAQLRRFLGSKKGRKIRYGTLLVDALNPEDGLGEEDDRLVGPLPAVHPPLRYEAGEDRAERLQLWTVGWPRVPELRSFLSPRSA